LKDVEEQTGYSKVFFFVPAVLVIFSVLFLTGGAKLVVDLVGFLYPAYMSFKSMDSGSEDDTQWLTYWVVMSFFSIFEELFAFVVVMIPFYYFIKIAITVWMYYPSTMGAKIIYEQGLRPLLLPYLGEAAPTKKSE
jgi:receptor expression-enhancing protein 5/6